MGKKITEIFVRINSRVRPDQLKSVKDLAKKIKKSEGETHRIIIDYYMHHLK